MTSTVRHVRIRRLVLDRSVAGSAALDREALATAIGRALDEERTGSQGVSTTQSDHAERLAALIAGGLSGSIGMAPGHRGAALTTSWRGRAPT